MARDRSKLPAASRRQFMKAAGAGLAALAGAPGAAKAFDIESLFQRHFHELSDEYLEEVIQRLEEKYSKKYGRPFTVDTIGPYDGVVFGYGLDISRCIGCRRCVYACVGENNQSRDPQIHWIRVLEFERERVIRRIDFEEGDPFYNHDKVPAEGMTYLPVACQQCEEPGCVKACPTGATWQEPDGIVTIDYDWCIGCRYCMTACPYGARHFNWTEPQIPSEEVNPNTHFLGNRPRQHGVVEKCTWCIQRTRRGKYPACVEVCPVGARKFGNLLDPNGEMRHLLDHKRTFVLKADLNTRPKFFYFYG
ncbi:MAG: 4Fe-4S dicluster domain-containing protein [Deltaproteobacteria bacterium]|nr:4Fe-4S dicluster domain-containing protein [Deltaproteobacteria bacterium]